MYNNHNLGFLLCLTISLKTLHLVIVNIIILLMYCRFCSGRWYILLQDSQVIAKVWREIRGGVNQMGGATQSGGVTQIFAAPKFLLAVQFYLLFIIDQDK